MPGLRFDQHRRYFGGFSNRRMLAEAFNASIGGHVRQVAAAIGAPTLLIAGELDEIGSVASQRSLAALFPDATLRVIPGVGHLVHYEYPRRGRRHGRGVPGLALSAGQPGPCKRAARGPRARSVRGQAANGRRSRHERACPARYRTSSGSTRTWTTGSRAALETALRRRSSAVTDAPAA